MTGSQLTNPHASGCALLHRLFPNNPLPAARLDTFVNAWVKGTDGVTITPKGLAFSGGCEFKALYDLAGLCKPHCCIRHSDFLRLCCSLSVLPRHTNTHTGPWGSLRHVGNAVFLMKAYAKTNKGLAPAVKVGGVQA